METCKAWLTCPTSIHGSDSHSSTTLYWMLRFWWRPFFWHFLHWPLLQVFSAFLLLLYSQSILLTWIDFWLDLIPSDIFLSNQLLPPPTIEGCASTKADRPCPFWSNESFSNFSSSRVKCGLKTLAQLQVAFASFIVFNLPFFHSPQVSLLRFTRIFSVNLLRMRIAFTFHHSSKLQLVH